MSKIVITELHFNDSEKIFIDLNDGDCKLIYGGNNHSPTQILEFVEKVFEFAIVAFAIATIVELVDSYLAKNRQ
ncbi:hypothetical protein [Anabaena subtropica]|uniref:Uncharacterized protein n=1 Tax=Anabaena subtropica FACHB-260 TaxID=2692884 RepID=A0ABR8CTM7_9NOST|nr:hypothetical protein [Anabaena subtropica]MBD2345898.1 hypothetical protein [Anabaena subtropica FACHB-260]